MHACYTSTYTCMSCAVPFSKFLLLFLSHITTLKLDQKSSMTAGDSLSASTPWNHGYAEMSGQRNK